MAKSKLKAGKLALKNNILDSLQDAVILVDTNREVIGYNLAANSIMPENSRGKDLSYSFDDAELLIAIDRALKNGPPATHEITFPFPLGRTYEIAITSLANEVEEKSGMMLAMHDITSIRNSERIRADFVANVSHELRSPLTSLMGFIETLQGPAKDHPTRQQDFLDIMAEESKRMALLVDDLLSLSLVEAHEHEIPDGNVTSAEFVNPVVERLRIRAQKNKMTISVVSEENEFLIRGDFSQLSQVVENLIDNAIKYGDEGSQVDVLIKLVTGALDVDYSALAISIKNQGSVIADEDIPRLTERFYRVDKARSQAIGGTGLGLAIVKHIINRHRGKLSISSVLNKGTVFTAYIPLQNNPGNTTLGYSGKKLGMGL